MSTPARFALSKGAFYAWCDTLRDDQGNPITIDPAQSWLQFIARIETLLRRNLSDPFRLDAQDDGGNSAIAGPGEGPIFFKAINDVHANWRDWVVPDCMS